MSTSNAAADAAKTALIDITVTDPTSVAALAAASKTRGHAAEVSAKQKHKHYAKHVDSERYVLVPAALEVFGAACSEMHSFVDAVVRWRAESGSSTQQKSSIAAWWRKRISFALQAGTSIAVDAAWRRSRPNTGYMLHTSVALVHTPTAPPPAATATAPALTCNSYIHSLIA